ncbi:MAG: DUF4974 domain-containing protein [Bacteroides sp.]|nr:DUF4974 domain-containing protein [Bacteroides sp.]
MTVKEKIDNLHIENLLLDYYEGYTSEEETARVEEWIKASGTNRKIARQMQLFLLATDEAWISPKLDVKKALENIRRRMETGTVGKMEEKAERVNRYKILFGWIQRIAAILIIPLSVMLIKVYWENDRLKAAKAEMVEVRTNPGMTASVVLPDGTDVTLNSSSSLQYPSSFVGEKREVRLTGEAYFSVTKDQKREFVVQLTDWSKIVVHGTEFNVDAYDKERNIQTTLVTGSVDILYQTEGVTKSLKMKPGQKATLNAEQALISVKKANVEVETAWKNGKLLFKNTPFEEVLKSLSKRYNVRFIIRNEALKKQSFTATFTKQRLERILEIFRISSNIRFKYVENKNVETENQIIEVY